MFFIFFVVKYKYKKESDLFFFKIITLTHVFCFFV